VLKVKAGSPIRKGKVAQGGRKVLSSSAALASVTGNGPKRRKPKVNDENKENSDVGTRTTRATGVNGNTIIDGKKKKAPLGTKTRRIRLPLKELPVNGFVEKGEGVSSVEVVVFFPR